MSSKIYLDTNALQYAFQAGGAQLIQIYLEFARSSGFTAFISDVVFDELRLGPSGASIIEILGDANVETVATLEFVKYQNYLDGNPAPGYTPGNRGERSILELANADLQAGHSVATLSDDNFFNTSQNLRGSPFDSNLNLNNADILRSAAADGHISAADFNTYVDIEVISEDTNLLTNTYDGSGQIIDKSYSASSSHKVMVEMARGLKFSPVSRAGVI